jgi:magnesium transporter
MLAGASLELMKEDDDYLLLERDLLDQQIIDVHGHKVVRVNDVDMVWENAGSQPQGETVIDELRLRIAEVEVGLRGALRRLLKGLPASAVLGVASRVSPSVIPWDFVDLIDRDPARRVRLKIEQDRLSKMHPSDLADILEELAAAESQALFSSLDEEVAAEALEEVGLKTQKKLIESLDSASLAGIIEEMDPGAAADLLSELSDERSDAILEEMSEKERHDVEELLEYESDSAAGLMTTEFLAVPETQTVADAIQAVRQFEGDPETLTDLFLLNPDRHLTGIIALSRLMISSGETPLLQLHEGRMVSSNLDENGRKVAELFDKYNLRCLPVLDEEKRLAGVIHAEHVIAWLRTGK